LGHWAIEPWAFLKGGDHGRPVPGIKTRPFLDHKKAQNQWSNDSNVFNVQAQNQWFLVCLVT